MKKIQIKMEVNDEKLMRIIIFNGVEMMTYYSSSERNFFFQIYALATYLQFSVTYGWEEIEA